jgi:glycosyltransferase involved in cell wall biosynthesis
MGNSLIKRREVNTRTLQIVGDSKYGGAGYLLLRWCDYLVSRGWEVDVLATDPFVVAKLEEINHVCVIKDILIPREITPLQDLSAFFKLMNRMKRERYRVVHTYTAAPSFLGRIAARLSGVPVIVHHQAGWTVTDFSSPLEKLIYTSLEYIATLASTRSICVSHAIKQQAAQLHIAPLHKLVTICNGIDPQPFIAASEKRAIQRKTLEIPDGCLAIGSTGRLSLQKDNATLIRGAAYLRENLPSLDFRLLLAGDGPDFPQLDALRHELNLTDHVRFLGICHEIPEFLAALDVFISSTLREGMSISILEAMAAAKPIVATSIAPNVELIEDGVTGLLAPVKMPEKIAEAITRFVQEPVLAQKCALGARRRLLENYTLDRMFQETWDLYLDLLGEKVKKLAQVGNIIQ